MKKEPPTSIPVALLDVILTMAEKDYPKGSKEMGAFISGGAAAWGWLKADMDLVKQGKPSQRFNLYDLTKKEGE